MAIRMRPARSAIGSRASRSESRPDNRLTMVDHAFYSAELAIDQKQIMQVVWVYEHPINVEGLKRFNHNLGHGLLGRRIERSPLSFARHRWVSHRGAADIDIAERP